MHDHALRVLFVGRRLIGPDRPSTDCRVRALLVIVAVSMFAIGCASGGNEPAPTDEGSPVTSVIADTQTGTVRIGSPPAPVIPSPFGVPDVTQPLPLEPFVPNSVPAPGGVTIGDVRVEPGVGSDRMVFDLGGDGTLFYVARYVAEAIEHGTSRSVEIPGRTILQFDVMGTKVVEPVNDGGPVARSRNIWEPSNSAIQSVSFSPDLDGVTQVFVGTSLDHARFEVTSSGDELAVSVDAIS